MSYIGMNNIAYERTRLKTVGKTELSTLKGLASYIGVSEKTLARWEHGDNDIPSQKAVRLADVFGCSVDYMLGRSDKRTPV